VQQKVYKKVYKKKLEEKCFSKSTENLEIDKTLKVTYFYTVYANVNVMLIC